MHDVKALEHALIADGPPPQAAIDGLPIVIAAVRNPIHDSDVA